MRQPMASTFSILLIAGILSYSTQTQAHKFSAVKRKEGLETPKIAQNGFHVSKRHRGYRRNNVDPGSETQSQSRHNVSSTDSNMPRKGGLTTPDNSWGTGTIYAGVAVDAKYLSDSRYTDIIKQYFQVLTPGNEMKWDATEKSQGVFSFAAADKIVQFGKQNGKWIRGHTAVWNKQVPEWLQQLDAQALVKATQNHIQTVLQHYKNDLYSFDICNEVVGDDTPLRDSFWSQKLNDSFIEMAFKAGIDARTNIKLYINDYGAEGPGKKSDALYAIAKKLSRKKLLHGVGFQGHMTVGKLPSLEGLEVAYTEVDIRVPLPASPKDLAQKAKDFATMVTACKETMGCKGLSVWGVTSIDSWIPSTYPGFGDAVLFDANYMPTPAFQSFEMSFKGTNSN